MIKYRIEKCKNHYLLENENGDIAMIGPKDFILSEIQNPNIEITNPQDIPK